MHQLPVELLKANKDNYLCNVYLFASVTEQFDAVEADVVFIAPSCQNIDSEMPSGWQLGDDEVVVIQSGCGGFATVVRLELPSYFVVLRGLFV